MKKLLLSVLVLAAMATPAHAAGGMTCSTAGPRPVTIALVFGHVAGSPLSNANLRDSGREVAVRPAQWWLDQREMRLILTDPQAIRQEAIVRVTRNGRVYDGNVWRGGQRRWVRCREG